GVLVGLLLVAAIWLLLGCKRALYWWHHREQSDPYRWLPQHYEESLELNRKAVAGGERSLQFIGELQERQVALLGELGKKLGELKAGLEEQLQAVVGQITKPQKTAVTPPSAEQKPVTPLHRPAPKPPILIDPSAPGDIEISVELDLPLQEEKQLAPEDKKQLVRSLRRRAQEKAERADFIRDEAIENYNYVPEEPLPEPKPTPARVSGGADLDYLQKFRYTPRTQVLRLEPSKAKKPSLRIREELEQSMLVVAEEE
ncbi:MAG: hypothetical protein NZL89_04825, partial [Leptospiraceae bacterium]|nr:hypothetical protein [Leptospiraceae bacterium]